MGSIESSWRSLDVAVIGGGIGNSHFSKMRSSILIIIRGSLCCYILAESRSQSDNL